MSKLWLLKYKNGRIHGPLSEQEITQLIKDKIIHGEETIAVYPGGRWKPISVEPMFYEQLLQILSSTDNEKSIYRDTTAHSHSDKDSYLNTNNSVSSATVIADVSELRDIKRKNREKKRKTITRSSSRKRKKKSFEEKTLIYSETEQETSYLDEKLPLNVKDGEAEKKKGLFFKKNKKWILTIVPIAILCVFLFFEDEQKKQGNYIELKKPKETASAVPKEELKDLIKKGTVQYLRSTVSSYIKAQSLLVQAVEGDIKNTYAMAILCLVYLELWPFTKKDLKSMKVISYLTHKTSVLNKGGVRSGLCHSVNLIIKGKYEDAKTMIESSLDGLEGGVKDGESNFLVQVFYYLKARVLYYLNDYITMMSYLDFAHKMLPKWIAPYMLNAEVLMKQNKISDTLSVYNKIIKINPQHKAAKIKKNLIEYKYFNKEEKVENNLKIALGYPDIVSNQVLSEAYFGLAEINIKKGNSSEALKYAQLAYSYNPAHQASRNLVIQIGSLKKLKETQVKSDQFIYEGDQLVLDNKCQSAIGYYEEAFKADGKKNAMVAVKIAKCYWTLSFSDQAIKWLKKAIDANPVMMEAYVLMAEYYSEQYDFYNAEKILQIAFRKVPRSYELYRGKAYLALKKGDYNQAIRHARKALRIYEADVESHVLLSEAYLKMGDLNEALSFAQRGLEVDPNAVKTQIAYAKALGSVYGVDTGVNQFRKMVANYPMVIKYREEWAKYLFEDEQYKRAKDILSEIIEIEPQYNEPYFYLGRILMFEGSFKQAYEAFLQAAILDPSDPRPTFYIGQLRLKEKRYSLAKTQFEKVLALNKLYPKAHYYLGRIAFLRGKYETAISHARKESISNPRLILPYLLAGEAYEKMGQYLSCAIEYQKAVEQTPENMRFYVKTARCYRKSGHLDLAVKILKKASGEDSVETKSGDPQLYKELGIINETRGDYGEALGAYCKYLNLMPQAPDRKLINARMAKLSKITGKPIRKCG